MKPSKVWSETKEKVDNENAKQVQKDTCRLLTPARVGGFTSEYNRNQKNPREIILDDEESGSVCRVQRYPEWRCPFD